MRSTRKFGAVVLPVAALILFVLPSAASAQATRTWVSGVGNDADPCSRTAPCKTFAGAISKTATGGEINCLDPGGFGGVTITKALTIDCHYTEGGVLVAATNGIIVNAPTTAKVIIRGLDINGLGQTTGPGTIGIRVLSGKSVRILDDEIQGFTQFGIDFNPGAGITVKGTIKNTDVTQNAGTALRVAPSASNGSASVTVRNSSLSDNGNCGVGASSHGAGAFCGTNVSGTGGLAIVNIFGSDMTDNTGTGVFSSGQFSRVSIGDNVITGNANGLQASDVGASGGIFSFQDNYIFGNTTNGTPTGTLNHTKR